MKTLIIGGTKGFGAQVAENFHKNGHQTVSVGRSGGDYSCDMTDGAAWKKVAEKIAKDCGTFDLIVCVVGYARAKPSSELTDADWITHANANLWYVESALTAIEHRRFITTGSQWSYKTGNDQLLPYIQAKHALRELTEHKGGVHYCVPTMDTPQLWKVWNGISPTANLADSSIIAKKFVEDALHHKRNGTFIIAKDGEITPLTK